MCVRLLRTANCEHVHYYTVVVVPRASIYYAHLLLENPLSRALCEIALAGWVGWLCSHRTESSCQFLGRV